MKKLANEFKSGFVRGTGQIAALISFGALTALAAQSLNVFSAGDLISASALNTNFQIAAPEGAVMAFYLSACPSGWVAADGTGSIPDLRGVFLRGMDDFGTAAGARGIDADGSRALGNFQNDAFQGHYHGTRLQSVTPLFAAGVVYSGADWTFTPNNLAPTGPPIDGGNGTPRTGNETRPKNIALLFCIRKNS